MPSEGTPPWTTPLLLAVAVEQHGCPCRPLGGHCRSLGVEGVGVGTRRHPDGLVGQPLKSTGELLLDESPVYLVCDGMSREEFIGKMKRVILTKGGKL